MMLIWDGITTSELLRDNEVTIRHQLADAAKRYDWDETFKILQKYPHLINNIRPDGRSLYTPLHQAAHGNAPVEVVRQLINMGGWRSVKNANGEKAIDIAKSKNYHDLVRLLKPVYKTKIPLDTLQKIEQNFHTTILGRAKGFVEEHNFRLPELEVLIETNKLKELMLFPIPSMYGGFNSFFETDGKNAKLITESSSRICGGSGQRHEITSQASILVDSGFI